MRILHVSLGNPKFHAGGLNRYCKELMEQQAATGDRVFLLFPGKFTFKKTCISRVNENIFEIINPLPVPITYGIDDPLRYMKTCSTEIFEDLLREIKPHIIHIHSIQGIYKEFFETAYKMCIPMVFTTHDYYPICLKGTLLKRDGILCSGMEPGKCTECNINSGLSMNKQIILQSDFYKYIKKNPLLNRIRKRKIKEVAKEEHSELQETINTNREKYEGLITYYTEIVELFSHIHCNSPATYEIYKSVFSKMQYSMIPITHMGIVRGRHFRKKTENMHFGYMGGVSFHKGYKQLEAALNLLDSWNVKNWEAYFYGPGLENIENDDCRKHYGGMFSKEKEQEVWNQIDVLVVPSLCRETFGFVVLEALSQGIPVICSDLVGSRYLVEQIAPSLIYPYNRPDQLAENMRHMYEEEYYETLCKKISAADMMVDLGEHNEKIKGLYRRIINGRKN